MTLKIRIKREECIGAAACIAAAPDTWKLADDGKADLIGGIQKGEFWEKEVPDEEFDKQKAAAEQCPVIVIEIWKDGKKVFPE